jgi:hypothetical protein
MGLLADGWPAFEIAGAKGSTTHFTGLKSDITASVSSVAINLYIELTRAAQAHHG